MVDQCANTSLALVVLLFLFGVDVPGLVAGYRKIILGKFVVTVEERLLVNEP